MSYPLQTTVDSICSGFSGPIIIDCQNVPEYKSKIIASLQTNPDNKIYFVENTDTEIRCTNVNRDESLTVQELLQERNQILPEFFFIITSDYPIISEEEKIFRDRSSLGRLKPTLFIRNQIESHLLPQIDSISQYDPSSANHIESFLRAHCNDFPPEEIASLHKIITYLRHYARHWNRKKNAPIDELILQNFTSVEQSWNEIGTLFNIDFTQMPSFTTITNDEYFMDFLISIEYFFGHLNSFITTLNKKLKLGLQTDYLRFQNSTDISFRISRIGSLTLKLAERSTNRQFKISEYLRYVVRDELTGDLRDCVENLRNLTKIVRLQITNTNGDPIPYSNITVKIINPGTGSKKGVADHSGFANIHGLVEGNYRISVSTTGYSDTTVDLSIGNQDASMVIPLEPFVSARPSTARLNSQPQQTPRSTAIEKYKITLVDRFHILVSKRDDQFTINTDFAQLPNGDIQITSLTRNGTSINLESNEITNTYPTRIMRGNPKSTLQNDEVMTKLLVDLTNNRYTWRLQKISEYFTDPSLVNSFFTARTNIMGSETIDDSLVEPYWAEYNNHLISADLDLVKKLIWLDVTEVSQCNLPRKYKITITENETIFVNADNNQVYLIIDQDGNLRFVDSETKKIEMALMHETHPCKQYAINKNYARLTGLPIVICDQRSELYNYRGGKPSLFIKSSSTLVPDVAKEYWNIIEKVQHLTIGSSAGELSTLPGRILTMIENGYLEKRNPDFSSGEFRLISFGAGRGDVEKDIIYKILTEPNYKIDNSTVCLVDEADQILGKSFTTTDPSMQKRIDQLLIGEDYKSAISKLKDKILPFDIALISRLLHTSSQYGIAVIGRDDAYTDSEQDVTWGRRSLVTKSDENLIYPQHPYHRYYAGCQRLHQPSSNVKKYCLPTRNLGNLEDEMPRIISQLMSLSWGAVIVDLDYNADLIFQIIEDKMIAGQLDDLDINIDLYSYEGSSPSLVQHSQLRTNSSQTNRILTSPVDRPQNSSFYFTLLMNNDEPITTGESTE